MTIKTNQAINDLMKSGLSYEEAVSRTDPGKRKKALENRAKLKKKKAHK